MRSLLFTICIILGLGVFACQSTDNINSENITSASVPQAVQTTFSKFFPNSYGVKWDKSNNGYNAKFRKDGHTVKAKFQEDGAMIDLES